MTESRLHFLMLLLAVLPCGRASASEPVAARKPVPRVDVFGDPLPEGAIARLQDAKEVRDGRFTPHNRYFLSGTTLWEVSTGRKLRSMKAGKAFITPQGTPLYIPRRREDFAGFRTIDLRTGKTRYKVRLAESGKWKRYHFEASPDGSTILTVFRSADFSKTRVTTYDSETGKLKSLLAESDSVGVSATLSINADGNRIAALQRYRRITIWDGKTGKLIRHIALSRKRFPHGIAVMKFSANGRALLGLFPRYRPAYIAIWDVASGRSVLISQLASRSPDERIAISPTGRHFAQVDYSRRSTKRPRVRILDLRGDPKSITSSLSWDPPQPQFSRDGAVLATLTSDLFDLRRMRRAKFKVDGLLHDRFRTTTGILMPSNALGYFLVVTARRFALIETCSGRPFYRSPPLVPGPPIVDGRSVPTRKPLPTVRGRIISDDGRFAVVVRSDSRAYVYATGPCEISVPKTPRQLEAVWKRMGDADAAIGRKAQFELAGVAEARLLPFLTAKLTPRSVDVTQVKSLIRDLGSKQFKTRSNALFALKSIGPLIEARLKAAYRQASDLETKQRLQMLLDGFGPWFELPTDRRRVRCVNLLSTLRTKSSRRLLERLARRAGSAPETLAARDAMLLDVSFHQQHR